MSGEGEYRYRIWHGGRHWCFECIDPSGASLHTGDGYEVGHAPSVESAQQQAREVIHAARTRANIDARRYRAEWVPVPAVEWVHP